MLTAYARLLRGRIALEQGDAKRALDYFEQGIRSWPNNAGARYLAGRAALELGDTSRAVSELREAIRVDNTATRAAEVLARLHLELGEYNDALRVARLAQRRLHDSPDPAPLHMRRAQCCRCEHRAGGGAAENWSRGGWQARPRDMNFPHEEEGWLGRSVLRLSVSTEPMFCRRKSRIPGQESRCGQPAGL